MGKAADHLTEDEQLLILDFQLVAAVRAIRARVGLDLRTAKALVDKYGVEEGLKAERDCEVCQGKGKVSDWKQPAKTTGDSVSVPLSDYPRTGTRCGAPGCGKPQFQTPHGAVCDDGHGGAPAMP